MALEKSKRGIFTRTEAAAWAGWGAARIDALLKRAVAAGEVLRICRTLFCLHERFTHRRIDPLPRLFVSCGRQDDLYPLSRAFPEACLALGIPVEYHEEDAKHDWFIWDSEIKRFPAAVLGSPE